MMPYFTVLGFLQPDLLTYSSSDFRVFMEQNGCKLCQINQMWLKVVGSYGLRWKTMIQHNTPIFI